jgi:hypothetical protein
MPSGRVATCVIVLCGCAFALDVNLPLGFAGGIPYAFIVGVASLSRKKALVFGAAIGSELLILVGYGYSPGAVSPDWIVSLNRLLAMAVVLLLALLSFRSIKAEVERDEALRERERALSELRILGGIIPICASCKKVRSNEGVWEHLESYISLHSEAEFSHGICEDCGKILYDEFGD